MPHTASLRRSALIALLLLLVGSPLARANDPDGDGDGVADASDLCPATPAGIAVDPAGCEAMCEVAFVGESVFLQNPVVEVGLWNGVFGSAQMAPAGFRSAPERLAIIADPARTGWGLGYSGDYIMPGTPVAGFVLQTNTRVGAQKPLMGELDFAPRDLPAPSQCHARVCGERGGSATWWRGRFDDVEVTQAVVLPNEGAALLVWVTLENDSSTAQDLYFMHSLDPDPSQPWTGDFNTYNEVVSQGGESAPAVVTATGRQVTLSVPAPYLALASPDPDARVAHYGYDNRDPTHPWHCVGTNCLVGESHYADEAINLTVRKQLDAGERARFLIVYAFSEAGLADAFACAASAACGDGDPTAGELCDDGNTDDGDGCDATCAPEAGFECAGAPSVCTGICGDGLLRGDEVCDVGGGDGCDPVACTVVPGYACDDDEPSTCELGCGDGVLGSLEACDDGNHEAGDGCAAACRIERGFVCDGAPSVCAAVCGDGIVTGAETCDDGNNGADDGCDATCQLEPGWACGGAPSTCAAVCGDGYVRADEACDDGDTDAGDGCDDACQLEPGWACAGEPMVCLPICGDGRFAGGEPCDDGNTSAGDGCDESCALEPGWLCAGQPSACNTLCGDGLARGDETCDDDNQTPGDGCDASCQAEPGWACAGEPTTCAPVCGDGTAVGAEACDDGGESATCNADCTVATCGDGVVNPTAGEACDDGAESATCNADCSVATCGDGIVNATAGEACDDGNTTDDDGCSSACRVELPADAGPSDDAGGDPDDAGAKPEDDAGPSPPTGAPGQSCGGCASSSSSPWELAALLLPLALLRSGRRTRRRRTAAA